MIVPTDTPTTSALCRRSLRMLEQLYPFVRRTLLTRTRLGTPLEALTLGTGDRHVLFTAGHHANEWITSTLLLKFAQELARSMAEDTPLFGIPGSLFRQYVTVHLVPMVDPDGVDLVTGALGPETREYQAAARIAARYPTLPFPAGWKANLAGVDLNLQYPAGWLRARQIKFSQGYTGPAPRDYVGRAPLTQPEAAALACYTRQTDPRLVLAFHSQGQVIYWQYGSLTPPGALELGREFSRLSGYSLAQVPYASSFAGYKDWFIQSFHRPGFTVEVGLGENPLPLSQFPEIFSRNLGILTTAALGLPGGA